MTFPILQTALDGPPHPVRFFFRDDDVGWADDQLLRLCDLFGRRAPLDLAVIPMAMDGALASNLIERPGRLGFHQHGYAHENHQPAGRKCELADDRPPGSVGEDLRAGQIRMRRLFGDRLDPIFTPPWNRCGVVAAEALVAMGVGTLSRDIGATPLGIAGLAELPVSVDWAKYSQCRAHRPHAGWQELDRALAAAVANSPVGVMLHHQVMGDADFIALDRLIDLLGSHRNVEMRTMAELTAEPAS